MCHPGVSFRFPSRSRCIPVRICSSVYPFIPVPVSFSTLSVPLLFSVKKYGNGNGRGVFPSVFILGTLPFWLHRLSCEYLLIILVLLWRPWRRVLVVVASCPGTVLLVHSRAVCRRTDCLASHIILS